MSWWRSIWSSLLSCETKPPPFALLSAVVPTSFDFHCGIPTLDRGDCVVASLCGYLGQCSEATRLSDSQMSNYMNACCWRQIYRAMAHATALEVCCRRSGTPVSREHQRPKPCACVVLQDVLCIREYDRRDIWHEPDVPHGDLTREPLANCAKSHKHTILITIR